MYNDLFSVQDSSIDLGILDLNLLNVGELDQHPFLPPSFECIEQPENNEDRKEEEITLKKPKQKRKAKKEKVTQKPTKKPIKKKTEIDTLVTSVGSSETSIKLKIRHNTLYTYFLIYLDDSMEISLTKARFDKKKIFLDGKKTRSLKKRTDGKFEGEIKYGNNSKDFLDIILTLSVNKKAFKDSINHYVNVGVGKNGIVEKSEKVLVEIRFHTASERKKERPIVVQPRAETEQVVEKIQQQEKQEKQQQQEQQEQQEEEFDEDCFSEEDPSISIGKFLFSGDGSPPSVLGICNPTMMQEWKEKENSIWDHSHNSLLSFQSSETNDSKGSKECSLTINSISSQSSSGNKSISSETTFLFSLQTISPPINKIQIKNTEISTTLRFCHNYKMAKIYIYCSLHDPSPIDSAMPKQEPLVGVLSGHKITRWSLEDRNNREVVTEVLVDSEKDSQQRIVEVPLTVYIHVTKNHVYNPQTRRFEANRKAHVARYLVYRVKDEEGNELGRRYYPVHVYKDTKYVSYNPVIEYLKPTWARAFSHQQVSVNGINFASPMMIYFGSTPAHRILRVTDSVIECVTPLHEPGFVTVRAVIDRSLKSNRYKMFRFIAVSEENDIIADSVKCWESGESDRKRKSIDGHKGRDKKKQKLTDGIRTQAIDYCEREIFTQLPYDKIHFACSFGLISLVERMIKKKKSLINKRDDFGKNPLFYSIRSESKEIVKLLISNGCLLYNRVDLNTNFLPLDFAVSIGNEAIVRMIAERVDINTTNKFGETALFEAVRSCNLELCKFLMDRGIDVTQQNYEGKNALAILPKGDEEFNGIYELFDSKSISYHSLSQIVEAEKDTQKGILDKNFMILYLRNKLRGSNRLSKVMEFSNQLKESESIIRVHLSLNGLTWNICKYLAEGIAVNRSITNLDLHCNNLKLEGMRYLCEGIKGNKSISYLYLYGNYITAKMALYLSEAIEKNSSVTKLDLGGNHIKSEGMRYLVDGIQRNTCLKTLNVRLNAIDTLPPIQSSSLTSLNISSNGISNVKNITCLSNLKMLDIAYNKIDYLPTELLELKLIRSIRFEGNPFASSMSFKGTTQNLLDQLREVKSSSIRKTKKRDIKIEILKKESEEKKLEERDVREFSKKEKRSCSSETKTFIHQLVERDTDSLSNTSLSEDGSW